MRIVEVIAQSRHAKELIGMARFYGAVDAWWGQPSDDGRQAVRMLVPDAGRQRLMDALQSLLENEDDARIVITPLDATLPRDASKPNGDAGNNGAKDKSAADEDDEARRREVRQTREELYSQIAKGARLDGNFLLLVVLSTIVAAIGLAEDNVAVIIGAMVIAPLLGPNIAFAFATALGDKALTAEALVTDLAGLAVALALSLIIGLIWPIDLNGPEIMARTDVTLASVALALASGAAAVLSLTTGLSSALVGVMVAVALLPPTAVLGMMLGHGRWELAGGAALLLAVNVVCVLLAAKIVFLARGVKPRTWLDSERARQSRVLYLGLWGLLLAVLVGVILVRGHAGLFGG
jgi:uncharacterized hydrophobic protein (TIGR00341 family)